MTVYVVERWAYEEPKSPLAVTRSPEGALRKHQEAGYRVRGRPGNSGGRPMFVLGDDDDEFADITHFELED